MNNNLIQYNEKMWEIVIGLEIHAQIATKSKLFSSSSTRQSFPNENVSFFDAGMPGMLPVLNEECVNQTIKTGFGINGKINKISAFDRKHYFYADLPAGYQITQLFRPIVVNGYVDINVSEKDLKRIRINRIHIEQDAGKSLHDIKPGFSHIDLNRAGVGLMEIVTEPDIRSILEAVSVAKKIHSLVRFLGTSDGNMESGNFRIDVNVSVHEPSTPFGKKVEIKNLNSFRFMQKSLNYEINRQLQAINSGEKIKQETRLFNTSTGETFSMREKEAENDYRYFYDPDLPPINLTDERIEKILNLMPELPDIKKQRFITDFELSAYDAEILTSEKDIILFFENAVNELKSDQKKSVKILANWIIVELFGALNKTEEEISKTKISPKEMSELVDLIQNGTISGKIAKEVFAKMFELGGSPSEIIKIFSLLQISSEELISSEIQKILLENEKNVLEYKSGKVSLFGFFVGEVMKKFKGKANPGIVNKILTELLSK